MSLCSSVDAVLGVEGFDFTINAPDEVGERLKGHSVLVEQQLIKRQSDLDQQAFNQGNVRHGRITTS